MIRLYSLGLICEPAGALSFTGLDKIKHLIKGKNVVCLLSEANIDLVKLDEAREIAAISKGIKNHYHIRLSHKKHTLCDLIIDCFKPTDIISIQYSRKFGKDMSQVLLSVESECQKDVEDTIDKLEENYQFENVSEKEEILDLFF